jgi:toxin CcdB
MAQFDVFEGTFAGDPRTPYVIALQSDLIDALALQVVAPLRHLEGATQLGRLTPTVTVLGQTLIFYPTEIVSLPRRLLGAPVANLAQDRDRIIAALDLLFTGI